MSKYIFRSIIISLLCVALPYFCNAQLTVIEKFDKLFLGENFDSSDTYWSTVSNTDNLLIVQEGEYIMHRKSTVSPYAVMANFSNDLSIFKMITSLKLDKTSAIDGSIGLIFMAQQDGKGGFIFEINKNSYRLRQITGASYKYITGTAKTGGWVESEFVKGLNLPNLVEIRTSGGKYDLLLNNNYLLGFSETSYSSGNFGFIIGPASKGKADFIYLFTTLKSKEEVADANNTTQQKENTPETDVLALAESIITLKTQINKLSEDNDDLKQIIQAMRDDEKENEKQKANYDKQIKELETRIQKSSASYDSLMKVNIDLMHYKEMVMGNDNGDLVINLSKNLKKEKSNSDELLKTNKQLTDSLTIMKNELKSLKGKDAAVTNQKDKSVKDSIPEKKSDKKEFILPKEN